MIQRLKIIFIAVFLLLTAIQLKLFYSIYLFEQNKVYTQLDQLTIQLKKDVESYEINRHQPIFEAYKNAFLCGEDYANKPLTLSFVIQPTEPFANLKELTDIIDQKLHKQAVASTAYLLEQLPVDSMYFDSLLQARMHTFSPDLTWSVLPLHSDQQTTEAGVFRISLFDDYRLYQPRYLALKVNGIQRLLIGNILLILGGSLLSFLLLGIATRYAYLSMLKYKKISENKAEFINHLAHEIKTPLSSIFLSGQALTDKRINRSEEAVAMHSQIIYSEAERLNKQLENVLSVSAAEKNFLEMHPEPLDVHMQIQTIAALFQARMQDLNGTLSMHLNASRFTCKLDKIHFGNVLYNLFDNAIKYSGQDSLHIHVETLDRADELVIRITDQGKGISRSEQEKIFQLFYKKDKRLNGFGVGLHYAKTILDFHRGMITVDSQPGQGTTFSLSLPLNWNYT
ncbi:MAG: HAMP domain-containing sensor histidine kinase [Bacteroidia bacterium]